MPGVAGVTEDGGEEGLHAFTVAAEEGQDVREAIYRAFSREGVPLTELYRAKASLEDVFLELTQDAGGGDEAGPGEDEKEAEEA